MNEDRFECSDSAECECLYCDDVRRLVTSKIVAWLRRQPPTYAQPFARQFAEGIERGEWKK